MDGPVEGSTHTVARKLSGLPAVSLAISFKQKNSVRLAHVCPGQSPAYGGLPAGCARQYFEYRNCSILELSRASRYSAVPGGIDSRLPAGLTHSLGSR